MSNQSNDPLTELQQAYNEGHISVATYHALADAYRAVHTGVGAMIHPARPGADERGVAIGGDVSDSTLITGDHARTTSAGTYIEKQTIFQTLAEPQHRPPATVACQDHRSNHVVYDGYPVCPCATYARTLHHHERCLSRLGD